MVGSRDFLIYGYAWGKFLSPDLLFDASFTFSKYSVFLQLIHLCWQSILRKMLHSTRCTIFYSKTLVTALLTSSTWFLVSKIIRCNCHTDCSSMRCTCKKHNMTCSPACGNCRGSGCTNSDNLEDEDSALDENSQL